MTEKSSSVRWDAKVNKQLEKLPLHIQEKFYGWVNYVRLMGIRIARQTPGFHDEPLKGSRRGQRSIRLNRAYRAIYVETEDGSLQCIMVIEVNKHEY